MTGDFSLPRSSSSTTQI
jgi:hypothetical protein